LWCYQELLLVTRKNGFAIEEKMGVAFVPLIGEKGLKSEIAGKLNAENKNPTIEIRQSKSEYGNKDWFDISLFYNPQIHSPGYFFRTNS
jgi:hypothetical protein